MKEEVLLSYSDHALRVALILALAWLLHRLAARLLRVFRSYAERRTGADELPRIETLEIVFRNAAAIIIGVIAITLVLGELGVSIAPILATAGVAGIAIGFGAQSLIKDYFNGFFLLIDDQLRQGDVVEIVGKTGQVEEVTLRYVRLRDADGYVHFVPNGEISVLTNRTRGYAFATVDIAIGVGQDIERALAVMREVGAALRTDSAWSARLPEALEVLGVEKMESSAVVLRCRIKVVPPIEQANVRRELARRLKDAYGEGAIEAPLPQLRIHSAPPKP